LYRLFGNPFSCPKSFFIPLLIQMAPRDSQLLLKSPPRFFSPTSRPASAYQEISLLRCLFVFSFLSFLCGSVRSRGVLFFAVPGILRCVPFRNDPEDCWFFFSPSWWTSFFFFFFFFFFFRKAVRQSSFYEMLQRASFSLFLLCVSERQLMESCWLTICCFGGFSGLFFWTVRCSTVSG